MLSHDNQLLISAYNDGEVSPDEQTRAEQLLVDDAAARAFREELLSMSSQLQSLPQHKLPADFSADVLAAAEKAMFTSQPWPGDTAVESASVWTRVFNSRTIAYAGATIAAAILVTLFIPHDGRDVADNADNEPAVADTPAAKDVGTAATIEERPNIAEKKANSRARSRPSIGQDKKPTLIGKSGGSLEKTAEKQKKPADSVRNKADKNGYKRYDGKMRRGATSANPAPGFGGKGVPAGGESLDTAPAPQSPPQQTAGYNAAFASTPPHNLLTASYDVRIGNRNQRSKTNATRSINEQTFRQARRQLAKRGVAWPVLKKDVATSATIAQAASKQQQQTLKSIQAKAAAINSGPKSSEPVVLYVEATAEQARWLLAALDADPVFRRDGSPEADALNLQNEFFSAAGFGLAGGEQGGGEDKIAEAAKDQLAERKLATLDGNSSGIRAYRLSRAESDAEAVEGGPVLALDESATDGFGDREVAQQDKKKEAQDSDDTEKSESRGKPASADGPVRDLSADPAGTTGRLVIVFRLIEDPVSKEAVSAEQDAKEPPKSPKPAANTSKPATAKPAN